MDRETQKLSLKFQERYIVFPGTKIADDVETRTSVYWKA
jgi:hypothetical protein